MPDENLPYEVGYGRPPKSGQFKKGLSGNSKGRPKGSKNLETIVQRESRQPVRINGPRGSRTVNKLEAAVMQIGNKAAQGDLPASREFINLVRWSEEVANRRDVPLTTHEMDQQVMQTIRRRMERMHADSANENVAPTTQEKSQ
jgi:Family of unknown function (DUF5681)